MPEDQENELNQIIKSQQEEQNSYDINSFMKEIATAAEQTIPDSNVHNRKQDCDPEILRCIKIRKDVAKRRNDDNIKEIIEKTARRIRTKKFVKGFKEKWDLIKNIKKGYTLKYTKMRNLDRRLVNNRERAEILANYFEQRQWHKTRQTPPEHNIPSNNLPETNLNIRTDDFDIQELNLAINFLKNNKSPGQNRITAELIKALDEDNKSHLLKLLNKCYRDKVFSKDINQADLAIIYKRSHRQTR